MKKLICIFVLGLLLSGCGKKLETINCKISEYAAFFIKGKSVIDRNNESSIADEMFKIDSRNKKLYQSNTVDGNFDLVDNAEFVNSNISVPQRKMFNGVFRVSSYINRNTGVYTKKIFHTENSPFYKKMGMYEQKYTYQCEKVKKKF